MPPGNLLASAFFNARKEIQNKPSGKIGSLDMDAMSRLLDDLDSMGPGYRPRVRLSVSEWNHVIAFSPQNQSRRRDPM